MNLKKGGEIMVAAVIRTYRVIRRADGKTSIANCITYSRVILAILVAVIIDKEISQTVKLIFCIAMFTDALDGWVARMMDQETKIGAFLDPVADKILVCTTLFAMYYYGLWWLALSIVIFIRELFILALRMVVFNTDKEESIKVTWLAKIKTILQYSCLLLSLLIPELSGVIIIAAIVTVVSGIDYFVKFRKALKGG